MQPYEPKRIEAAFALAESIEEDLAGMDSAMVMLAFSWVIAGMIISAEHELGTSEDHVLQIFTEQIRACARKMRGGPATGVH